MDACNEIRSQLGEKEPIIDSPPFIKEVAGTPIVPRLFSCLSIENYREDQLGVTQELFYICIRYKQWVYDT